MQESTFESKFANKDMEDKVSESCLSVPHEDNWLQNLLSNS